QHVRSAKGLSRARNRGLRCCNGDIIGFPDDDCWYDKDVTERVRAFFAGNTPSVLTGRTIDQQGLDSVSRHRDDSGAIDRTNVFLSGNSSTLFVEAGLARRIGFDETLGVGADTPFQSGEETDFLLRCVAAGAAARYWREFVVRHDQVESDGPASRARARGYAAGFGRLLRLNRYGLRHLAIPV